MKTVFFKGLMAIGIIGTLNAMDKTLSITIKNVGSTTIQINPAYPSTATQAAIRVFAIKPGATERFTFNRTVGSAYEEHAMIGIRVFTGPIFPALINKQFLMLPPQNGSYLIEAQADSTPVIKPS